MASKPMKPSVSTAKVNLPALLNDPRKTRRDHDLFTKSWGVAFESGAVITKSIRVPKVSKVDFMDYLSQTQDKYLRHQSQKVLSENSNEEERSENFRGKNFLPDGHNSYLLQNEKKKQSATREALQGVPRMFLRTEFSLEDSHTFLAVLNFNVSGKKHENQNNSFDVMQKISSSKLLQEKLSFYLDLVEVALVRQISVQSDAFFDAMTSHDELNDCLQKMLKSIHRLREKTVTISNDISKKTLKVVHINCEQKNKLKLLGKLQTMLTVHQAQPTIQLLLSTSEYAGALDVIETTQEVLKLELAGVHCFRHLSSQLSEIERVIGQMMQEELSGCIRSDIHRPLSEGYSTLNPHHLAAIAHGLLRREHLNFFDEFKEEIKMAVKTIIKETVMIAVLDAEEKESENDLKNSQNYGDNDEMSPKQNGAEKTESLAGRMRLLPFEEWISLLNTVFDNLSLFLKRVKSFLLEIISVLDKSAPMTEKFSELELPEDDQTLTESHINGEVENATQQMDNLDAEEGSPSFQPASIGDNVWDEMDQYESQLMQSVDLKAEESKKSKETPKIQNASSASPVKNNEGHINIIRSICESLSWTADLAHDRCVKIIIARNKNSSLEKLSTLQFLALSQAIEKYLADTETIIMETSENSAKSMECYKKYFVTCFKNYNKRSSVLRGVLHTQASHFISRFHDERKTKLSLILDSETWKQSEVPVELAKLIKNMSGEISNAGNASPSNEALTKLSINGASFTVVGTVLLLLKMVSEYMKYADDIPGSTPDLIAKVCELLSFFNSRTSQLLLGATALQLAGLKTITSRNLGLASRCVQLVLTMLPYIKIHFQSKLEQFFPTMSQIKRRHCLRHFDHVEKDYKDHIKEIESKLVNIMNSCIESNLTKWQVKAPMPSPQIRAVCRQITKLHETILDLLPKNQVRDILFQTHLMFKKHFNKKLQQYGVRNDGGPQCGLVMSDLAFYQGHVENLEVFDKTDLELHSVWL